MNGREKKKTHPNEPACEPEAFTFDRRVEEGESEKPARAKKKPQMYQTSACNPRGSFTPCSFGAPNREVLPITKPLGLRKVLLAEDYVTGIVAEDYITTYGSDGTITLNVPAPGILLDSYSYTKTSQDSFDHYKYTAVFYQPFPVAVGNETWVESTMAGLQLFPLAPTNDPCLIAPLLYPAAYDTYVRDPLEDLRLCCSGLHVVDEVSFMQYQLVFTNRRIWAVYSRLPFGKAGPGPDYFSFVHAVPVYTRSGADPINEFARLQIAVGAQTVRFFVNGDLKLSVPLVGLLLDDQTRILSQPAADGGFAEPVQVSSIQAGFGTFSMVDASVPDNYPRHLQPPAGGPYAPPGLHQLDQTATNYSPDYVRPTDGLFVQGARTFVTFGANPCERVWGQGSHLAIQNLLVYQQLAA